MVASHPLCACGRPQGHSGYCRVWNSGDAIGDLELIEFNSQRGVWRCRCGCGNETSVNAPVAVRRNRHDDHFHARSVMCAPCAYAFNLSPRLTAHKRLTDSHAAPTHEPLEVEQFGVDQVRDALRTLASRASHDARSVRVIELRYGVRLETGEESVFPMTLDEVGTVLGVSRERVRQLEVKALRNLQRIIRVADAEAKTKT